jgi:hypothetical protein
MNDQTGAIAMLAAPDILRRIVRLQILTVAWMTIEVVVRVGGVTWLPLLLATEASRQGFLY